MPGNPFDLVLNLEDPFVESPLQVSNHVPHLLIFGVGLQTQLLESGVEVVIEAFFVRFLVHCVLDICDLVAQLFQGFLQMFMLFFAKGLHLLSDYDTQS